MKKHLPLLASLLALVAASSLQGQIINDTFSTNTLTNYENPSGGRTAFTYDATNFDVNVASSVTAMAHKSTVGSFNSVGGTFSLSVDFLTVPTLSDAGSFNTAAVGLSTTAASFYGTFSGFEVTARQAGTAGAHFLRLRLGDNSTGQIQTASTTLTADTWYRLTLEVEATGTAQFYNVSASLATQAAPNVALLSINTTLVERLSANGFINNSDNLFAGLAGASNALQTGGSSSLDNFLVIPEPSTALLSGMGLVVLALRRRRA